MINWCVVFASPYYGLLFHHIWSFVESAPGNGAPGAGTIKGETSCNSPNGMWCGTYRQVQKIFGSWFLRMTGCGSLLSMAVMPRYPHGLMNLVPRVTCLPCNSSLTVIDHSNHSYNSGCKPWPDATLANASSRLIIAYAPSLTPLGTQPHSFYTAS